MGDPIPSCTGKNTVSDAARGLRQPGQLAGALRGAAGEQLVNLLDVEAGLFAETAHHRGDLVLQVV